MLHHLSGSDSAVPRFPDGIGLLSRLPCCPHTEVMRQHLLTAEGPEGAWRLSG
jgi:hypothetical protein